MLPSASQDTSPTAGQEVSPSAGQYMFPSAGQEVSPSAGQEVWPTADKDTLQTTGQNMLPSAGQYRSGEIDAVSCNVIRSLSFISNAEVRAAVGINKNNTYLFASTDILTTGPVQTYDEAEHRAGEKAENETEREEHHAPDEEYTSMGDDNYMEMLEEDGSGDDEEEYDGKRKRKADSGKKEYQVGNKTMMIEDTNPKQTVYMFKCQDSTLQVKGKINSIVIDSCKKVAIAFDAVVSSIEFVNCQSVQAQVMGKCPTVTIDKTDGCQMYLSKESTDAEIITAKSSEMNISVPKDDGDFIECPLPEQFKSKWNGKKFVTVISDV